MDNQLARKIYKEWTGVAITVAAILSMHYLWVVDPKTYQPSLAIAFAAMAYTAFNHAIPPTVVSAAIVALYALYLYSVGDFTFFRLAISTVSIFIVAAGMSWQKAQNRRFDNANSVRQKMTEAGIIVGIAIQNLGKLNTGAIRRILYEAQDRIGNAEAYVVGWQQISEEQQDTERRLKANEVREMIKKLEGFDDRPTRS